MNTLEELAARDTAVHRLHPAAKLATAVVTIVAVVSVGRYDLLGLVPYLFYPFLLMPLSETPYGPMLRRLALALPFSLLAGVSNVIFDTQTAFFIGGVGVSFGWIAFFTILVKSFLVVMAVLILVATTPMQELSAQMVRLKVPAVIVLVIMMTYRYISILLMEASSMMTAYQLRSPKAKGIRLGHMGSFVGQLLLRTMDRAARVYAAMKCRGYAGAAGCSPGQKAAAKDVVYAATVCALAIAFRFVDFAGLTGRLFL